MVASFSLTLSPTVLNSIFATTLNENALVVNELILPLAITCQFVAAFLKPKYQGIGLKILYIFSSSLLLLELK